MASNLYEFNIDDANKDTGQRYAPFERIFCISGVSSSSSANNSLVDVAAGATPRTLLLKPQAGETALIVRQVRITVDGASVGFLSTTFAADTALTTGLQFGLFNDTTSLLVDRFWKSQISGGKEWPTSNRFLVWAADRYEVQSSALVTPGDFIRIWTDFDRPFRGPLYLPAGFSLRVGLSAGDTIGTSTNVFAAAKGQIVV